jgi:ROS/MUCR transcriptional regulator protein
MEEVDDYLSGNTITCLLCHKRFQRLDHHLRLRHDITADAYRECFGIPRTRSLTSAASRARSSILMTAERIEEFTRLHAGKHSPGKCGLPRKAWAPALVNSLRKRVEVRRSIVRELVIVPCPKCGAAVSTNALSGTQPILCLDCSTPEALRERQAYLQQERSA